MGSVDLQLALPVVVLASRCAPTGWFDPIQHKPHYHLGLLAMKRRDLPAAETAFRESLRAKPDYALARRNLEAVLAESSELDSRGD